ncbi:MAG: 3-oxoacyl-ACP reductase FabG [Clostridia bacterium]|nr:3-oxoacyl-ACP reductase FabG [Clostridia bacterium]MBQ3553241.1 3-oxoacyl-ACP reductase FabG [Clostridia bacterium]
MLVMKNVLITGASRGIGAACAKLFAKNGFRVFVNYIKNKELAEAVCAECRAFGVDAISIGADISVPTAVNAMFSEIENRYGGVDILINNAGIAQQLLFSDITEADWNRMFDVNVKGTYLCSQAALPHMIHQKCGSIVNLSSMWGLVGASCEVHYSAAKAAVIGFTKALAKELAPSGIRVNCVAPGAVNTEMNAHLSKEDIALLCDETPLGRIASAEEIAEAIYFLAVNSSFTTGQILSPNGGLVI